MDFISFCDWSSDVCSSDLYKNKSMNYHALSKAASKT
jgi:hypothetical protein